MTEELLEAIEDVTDWLDYDVWESVPELERAVRRLNHARMLLRVQDRIAAAEAVAVVASKI